MKFNPPIDLFDNLLNLGHNIKVLITDN